MGQLFLCNLRLLEPYLVPNAFSDSVLTGGDDVKV